MATKEDQAEVLEYSPEDLEIIKDLTSFFNEAPGQVAIPEDDTNDVEPQDQIQNDTETETDNFEDDVSGPPKSNLLDTNSKPEDDLDALLDMGNSETDLDDLMSAQDNISSPNDEVDSLDDITDLGTPDVDLNSNLSDVPDLGDLGDIASENTEIDDDNFADLGLTQSNEDAINDLNLDDTALNMDDGGSLDNLEMPSSEDDNLSDNLNSPTDDFENLNFDTADNNDLNEAPDLGDLGDLTSMETPEAELGNLEDFDNETQMDTLPSLDEGPASNEVEDISLDDLGDFADTANNISETQTTNDFADLESTELPDLDETESLDDFASEPANEMLDMGDLDTPADLGDIDDMPLDSGLADLDDMQTPSFDNFSDDNIEAITPPSLDELSPEVALDSRGSSFDISSDLSALAREQASVNEVSDEEIRELRKTLKQYSFPIRKASIDAIIDGKLNDKEVKEFITRIIEQAPESEIEKYLTSKARIRIDKESKSKRAKVIVARPQYTESGLKRQARLIKYSQIAIIAALSTIILTTSLYYMVLKPMFYKNLVNDGTELILSKQHDTKALKKADEYFQEALGYYKTKSYAYLQFADAYNRTGMYEQAFEKLFGKLTLGKSKDSEKDNDSFKNISEQSFQLENKKIHSSFEFWRTIKKVPIVKQTNAQSNIILINQIPWQLHKEGAYLAQKFSDEDIDVKILLALGHFHSNPAQAFKKNAYKNNFLGIDYFKRILTFKVDTPMFQKEDYVSRAVLGIGNVYYDQAQYNEAMSYFEKMIKKNPYDVLGQSGVIKTLLKLYKHSNDPRMIIQQHSIIKHQLDIEPKLPLHIMAKLAAFYIDLPEKEDLRIKYNVSPTDHVTNQALKQRIPDLLNAIFNTTETDLYENEISGKSFAEGYYQRGRYYRLVKKQMRMAMKQMEYAYMYNNNHFMALNDRAEMLLELNDYQAAIDHLKMAEPKITDENLDTLGDRPEDETLLEADRGKIPFNIGKAYYLSTITKLGDTTSWKRIKESSKYTDVEDYGIKGLSNVLDRVDGYFTEALNKELRDETARRELHYYSGWSNYVKGDYKKALSMWESLEPNWNEKVRTLELAKSHAFYQLALQSNSPKQNLNAALANLLFLRNYHEKLANEIQKPSANNKQHVDLFTKLSIIENNLGAISEIMGDEKKALQHYWKSINYSKSIAQENEIAHLNIRLSFKRDGLDDTEAYPLIMDYVSPSIDLENQSM